MDRENAEILTRVGPGAAMGQLLREYWIPFDVSSEMLSDGPPKRIRLLGEDLLAFRDTDGRVGVVSPTCPHRSAPLFFGRNEEGGLRCVYHGWKFATDGRCLDMPTEPADCPLKAGVKLLSYPTKERNGVVWIYMGKAQVPPELPELEWNMVPESQCHISIRIQECNWVQALEGEIDSAHGTILHGRVDTEGKSLLGRKSVFTMVKHPRMEAMDTDYGVAIASLRQIGDSCYWRVNQFLDPFYTLVPPFESNLSGHAWVPIDDEHTLCFMFTYSPTEPLDPKILRIYEEGYRGRESGHVSRSGTVRRIGAPYETYWPKFSRANDFGGVDWQEQRERRFSGLPGLWVQDAACQSGTEPIADRTKQNLGTTDVGIVRMRNRLIRAAKRLQADQGAPSNVTKPAAFRVRAVAMNLAPGAAWKEPFKAAAAAEGPLVYSNPDAVES